MIEDSVSSPTYFNMMIEQLIKEKKITQDSIIIVPHDGSTHPTSVLNNLKTYKNSYGKTYKNFKHKWIVIDRDSPRVNGGGHSAEDFNNAIINAKKSKIKIAYANDSFELWYLLHFEYRTTAIMRDKIVEYVIEKLKEKEPHKFTNLTKENIKQANYTKLIFETLLLFQSIAIENAKKLFASYGETLEPQKDNPSTTIHQLVLLLNEIS